MKLIRGDAIVVASHNEGKVREIRELLEPYGFEIKGAKELNLPEPEETGLTFEDNAILKAHAAAKVTNIVALADDSGLCVHCLNDEPGIYTARYAKEHGGFSPGMKQLGLDIQAAGNIDTTAHFVCVLALADPSGEAETFRGEVYGHLEFPERGTNGFGFDPIFVMDGMTETYGEIPQSLKDQVNHRSIAFGKLTKALGLEP